MPTSPQLGLHSPVGADPDNVPADIQTLVDRLESILADGHDSLWSIGDIKYNGIKTADHGRWLLCDGRELTQAQIESALGLAAGKAAPFATALGTGGTSKYGAAAAGKVKLPDGRDKFLLGTHPSGTHTLGETGGVERVTLAANESGVASHNHGVTESPHHHSTVVPSHTHSITAEAPATSASTPAITVSDPGHTHTENDHGHGVLVSTNIKHGNVVYGGTSTSGEFYRPSPGGVTTEALGGSGATGPQDDHGMSTNGTGVTAAQAAHSHAVASHSHGGATGSAGGGTINSSDTTTGLSVNNAAAAPAATSHENMPPYLGIGMPFIRV